MGRLEAFRTKLATELRVKADDFEETRMEEYEDRAGEGLPPPQYALAYNWFHRIERWLRAIADRVDPHFHVWTCEGCGEEWTGQPASVARARGASVCPVCSEDDREGSDGSDHGDAVGGGIGL